MILDAETKLAVSMVIGPRSEENTLRLIQDLPPAAGTNYRLPALFISDGYPTYASALMELYGQTLIPPRSGNRGRPKGP